MIKSVLVAALSAVLITTGLAAPNKKPSRSHSKKSVASKSNKSKKETNRRASKSKAYNRGRRFVEAKETPRRVHHSTSPKNDIGRATVVGVNINVRSAPNSNASVVTKVSGGNVAITAQKGDWYKLRFQHGSEGWVREDFLKIAGKAPSPKVTPIKLDPTPAIASTASNKESSATADSSGTRYVNLVAKQVNIRKGPSTSNSTAGTVKGGRALVVDKWDDWYKVKFQHGTTGWVRKDFLVFPSNFDFKNNKKPIVQTKPETVVASKEVTKPEGQSPENVVENAATGERTVMEPETKPTNASKESGPVVAKVVGDNVTVRRGPSKSNSVLTRVDGGKAEIIDHRGDFYQLRFQHGTIGWVHANYVSYPGHEVKEAAPVYVASNGGDKINSLMQNANSFRGVRYGYGNASRASTDCSGFVLQVFRTVGISLPRTAREQASRGQKVTRWNLKTGDLVFFNTRGYISHVGIYIGDQHFIHASSGGRKVMESSLNDAYYGNRFLFGKRIIAESKVKKLELPTPGETPVERQDQRGDDENKVDISKDQKNDVPTPDSD